MRRLERELWDDVDHEGIREVRSDVVGVIEIEVTDQRAREVRGAADRPLEVVRKPDGVLGVMRDGEGQSYRTLGFKAPMSSGRGGDR